MAQKQLDISMASLKKYKDNSFSQTAQDLVAFNLCREKSYLEIGAKGPITRNNTFLLENNGWDVVSFEMLDYRKEWSTVRDVDRLNVINIFNYDFSKLKKYYGYLSLDIDALTMNCYIDKIRPSKIKFDVISMEHDSFNQPLKSEEQIIELNKDGYICFLKNIHLTERDTAFWDRPGPYENIYVSKEIWDENNLETHENLIKEEIERLWR